MNVFWRGSATPAPPRLKALRCQEGVETVCAIVPAADDRLALAANAVGWPCTVPENPKLVPGNAIPDGADLIVAAHTHARVSPEALALLRLGGVPVAHHPSLLPWYCLASPRS